MTNQEAINILLNEQKCIDRNEGIQCDRECGSCDLVMDVGIIREAYNMAINALAAQPETHSCDLIDRRALMKEFSDFVRVSNNSDFAPTPTWNDAVSLVKSMPPAQPSSSCVHENDYISRQAAIDVEGIDEQIRCEMCGNPMHTDRGCDGNCKYDEKLYEKIIQILNKRITPLPSAQPQRTGYWIEDDDEMFVICSECGEKNDYISAFCPDCGAKMINARGEHHETD